MTRPAEPLLQLPPLPARCAGPMRRAIYLALLNQRSWAKMPPPDCGSAPERVRDLEDALACLDGAARVPAEAPVPAAPATVGRPTRIRALEMLGCGRHQFANDGADGFICIVPDCGFHLRPGGLHHAALEAERTISLVQEVSP